MNEASRERSLNPQQQTVQKFYDNYTVYSMKEHDTQWIEQVRNVAEVAKRSNLSLKLRDLDETSLNLIIQNAEIHQKASVPSFQNIDNLDEEYIENNYCTCGCRKMRGNQISICSSSDQLYFLGSAISLYFSFTKVCIALIGFTVLVYSIFAFGSNMIGGEAEVQLAECLDSIYCRFQISTSMVNKLKWDSIILIQYWLSILVTIFWILVTWYLYYKGNQIKEIIQKFTDTPSQKAIKISNLPSHMCSEQMIKSSLQKQWANRTDKKANQTVTQLELKSIHLVYNMSFIRDLIQQIQDKAVDICKYLGSKSEIGIIKNITEAQYIAKKQNYMNKNKELTDIVKRFQNNQEYRKQLSTTCAIVEFYTSDQQKRFMKSFGVDNSSFWTEILTFFDCANNKTINFHGNGLTIQKAPEPEDVYWKNAQKPYSYLISAGILLAAVLIVLITLAILIAIEIGQNYLEAQNIAQTIVSIINYCKTFLIVIFNILIWEALRKLMKIDRKHTLSEEVISLISMSTFAETVNSIILPFVVVFANSDRLSYYGAKGVARVAFDFAVSNILITNALLFFDFAFIKNITLYFRCIRNCIIRMKLKGVDFEALNHQIKSVNQYYEGGDFDISESYTQITINLFHMSFYATMQPFVILIFFVGLVAKWFIKKYLLSRRYKYPKLYHKMVYDHIVFLLKLLPICYGVGMITTIVISPEINNRYYLFIPSGLCILLGAVNAANPWSIFDKLTMLFVSQVFRKKVRIDMRVEENLDDTGMPNDRQNIDNREDKEGDLQYYETSNLVDLFGYKSILEKGDYKKDLGKIKDWTSSFGTKNEKRDQ